MSVVVDMSVLSNVDIVLVTDIDELTCPFLVTLISCLSLTLMSVVVDISVLSNVDIVLVTDIDECCS